jgi:acyl-CoA thioesterase-2
MTDVPAVLRLHEVTASRYEVTQPTEAAEGRDVVYSGQLIAQMIMASNAAAAGMKRVRSLHSVFARAGTYTAPIHMLVDSMHAGRTWASDTVSAVQGERLLARGIVLLDAADDDLMRHEPAMPSDVPGPDSVAPGRGTVFPGAEWRPVPGELVINGAPAALAWHRFGDAGDAPAAHQAALAWATCGDVIGLAFRPHRSSVDLSQAHRTLSTGVIGHTIHFTDDVDVSEWLLFVTSGDKAGGGRILGSGQVFDTRGRLVAAFSQDGMAKKADRPLDHASAL